ncbi:hypothetical protein QJS10_CPB18g02018 [Acorus calamus]|uniref:CRIB domain-containing protein n=1 Tax=Acorus calamus TaxID=4465 RepID=A0AAV9CLY6_ACOCL|nr:hypothetical protein QJS10_CPB18g02018 [Acorus calamus]
MSTKMKGLLKGLRYISQIFDANGKEHEMQIGYPTDVKHVAHIGWDGPSVSSPSWAQMNEFRSAPLSSLGNEAMESSTTSRPSQGFIVSSPARNLPQHPLPKPGSRRQELIASSASSPSTGSPRRGHHPRSDGASTRELLLALDAVAGGGGGSGGGSPASPNRPRHSRRHQSTGGVSVDSPTRDSPSGSAAPGKTRHHRKAAAAAGGIRRRRTRR